MDALISIWQLFLHRQPRSDAPVDALKTHLVKAILDLITLEASILWLCFLDRDFSSSNRHPFFSPSSSRASTNMASGRSATSAAPAAKEGLLSQESFRIHSFRVTDKTADTWTNAKRKRSRFNPSRRQEVSAVRKKRACLRCSLLRVKVHTPDHEPQNIEIAKANGMKVLR